MHRTLGEAEPTGIMSYLMTRFRVAAQKLAFPGFFFQYFTRHLVPFGQTRPSFELIKYFSHPPEDPALQVEVTNLLASFIFRYCFLSSLLVRGYFPGEYCNSS